jgi:hypothetical protein
METCNETEACADGFKLFNTNLVFDRSGCIISRYRKFNLFLEPNMNITKEPEIATFTTDFGVTFGHFVCFDILFKSPATDLIKANVKHILYPSMWFSETPFLTSVQIQQAFAFANDIVLLSSGTNSPQNSNTGSGIFVGRHGAIEKFISYKNETRMMIAEVPKDVDDPDFQPKRPSIDPYTPIKIDSLKLTSFTPKNAYPLQEHFVATSGDVTCQFTVNYTNVIIPEGDVGYVYKFTVFSGLRSYAGIVNAGEVHCAIIACTDENDLSTCGRTIHDNDDWMPSVIFYTILINVTINGDVDDLLIMPTSLDTSIIPLETKEFIFKSKDNREFFMRSTEDDYDDLMSFGIYGRNFKMDGQEEIQIENLVAVPDDSHSQANHETKPEHEADEGSNLGLTMSIYVLLMVVLSILAAIMTYRKLQHPYVVPDPNPRKSRGSILG